MFPVGICNEDLAKVVAGHQLHYLFHASGIQFVEYVVEQQQGSGLAARVLEELELCQLQCDEERLILAL